MSRQTPEQVNEARRKRYAERTRDARKQREIRDFGIVWDRIDGLSLRQIAIKRGVSVGCVRNVIGRYTST